MFLNFLVLLHTCVQHYLEEKMMVKWLQSFKLVGSDN